MHWDTGQLLVQNSTGSKVSRHIITHTIIQILYIHVHGNDIKTDMTKVLAAFAQNLTKECLPLPQVFSLHKKARVRLALDSE